MPWKKDKQATAPVEVGGPVILLAGLYEVTVRFYQAWQQKRLAAIAL